MVHLSRAYCYAITQGATCLMNDRLWPCPAIHMVPRRAAGSPCIAAGRVICGIMAATDPKRPVADRLLDRLQFKYIPELTVLAGLLHFSS